MKDDSRATHQRPAHCVQHCHLYVLQQGLPSSVRRLPAVLPDQVGNGTLLPVRILPLAPVDNAHVVGGVCMCLDLRVASGFFSCESCIRSLCGIPRCSSMQRAAV